MKVWVTRDERDDGLLSVALRACGLDVVFEPVVERRVVSEALDTIDLLGPDDWLVLTSPYAIEAATRKGTPTSRIAVIAEPSRRLAETLGLRVELVSSGGDGKSLFAELRTKATSGTVCYARSSLAEVPKPWPGIKLLAPILYETTSRVFDRRVHERVDIVAVASPSAVRSIGRVDLPFASIGPTTSAALRKLDIEPCVEAGTPSFEALAVAIADYANDSRHQRA